MSSIETKCIRSIYSNTHDCKRYLVPLGHWENLGAEFLQSVEEYAIAFFTGMQVKVMQPVALEDKNLVVRINDHTQKQQYRTKELMEMLKEMLPNDAYCICGITFHGVLMKSDF